MGHLEYERDRIVAEVDKYIEDLEEKFDPGSSPQIDTFAIIAMVAARDENGNKYGQPSWRCDSQRPHVQLGLMRACLLRLEGSFTVIELCGDEDEDD